MKYDKWLHVVAGLMIFVSGWAFFNIEVGLTTTILIGLFKEVYDGFIKKTLFDFWDFIATIALPIIIYTIATL